MNVTLYSYVYTVMNFARAGIDRSELRGDDEDDSSGQDSVCHLHRIRLLLESVHRRPALRQLRQSPAARSHVHVHAGAPARQSQFRNLRPHES